MTVKEIFNSRFLQESVGSVNALESTALAQGHLIGSRFWPPPAAILKDVSTLRTCSPAGKCHDRPIEGHAQQDHRRSEMGSLVAANLGTSQGCRRAPQSI
jgi:hypothetical protein